MLHSVHGWIPVLGHAVRLVPLAVALLMALSSLAHAQGGGSTSALSGVVTDESGAVLPGANIVVKNNATSATFNAVTSDQGTFTVPALTPGAYTVTITMDSFKTTVLNDVVLNAGVPASVRAKMAVGGLEETVTVSAGAELLQTQSAAVTTTLDTRQILNLPIPSRSSLDFVTNLAGVDTPSGNRDSTVNGLPQSTINVTIDGMSAQDNHLKTGDGFFARVSPRLDSLEEVTVSTAAQDSSGTGQGAVQIRMVTKSGTNDLRGSAFYYLRNYRLNANTWFNNRNLTPDPATGKAPKNADVVHQPGLQVGGPIMLPGLFDGHNKAFFFFNYEEFRQPGQITRDRDILSPQAEAGLFRYNAAGGGVREVDLLRLAAQNGHLATLDPTIRQLLADIRSAATSTGGLTNQTDPNIQRLSFQQPSDSLTRYWRTRLDANLSARHKLYGSYYFDDVLSTPDTTNSREARFPGLGGVSSADSHRYIVQTTLRSTLSSNLVNELRVGATGGRSLFSPELAAGDFERSGAGNMGGFLLDINGDFLGIANTIQSSANSGREATTRVVDNTLNWLKGSHSIQAGASWTQQNLWSWGQTHAPTVTFGVSSNDPADAMFEPNLPGASPAQINDAKELYATLVGRVIGITSNARLNESDDQYQFLGRGMQRARLQNIGFYVSDSWRMRPNLTVSAGLRYELQTPFYPLNNSFSTATQEALWGVSGVGNLFQPGVQTGQRPTFDLYDKGTRAYRMDKNNFAPSVGVAWTVGGKGGFLKALLGGEGNSVLKGGYAIAYNRPGMSDFTDTIGRNPGVLITTNRDHTINNLGAPGTVLLRNRGDMAPPAFPSGRNYPMTDVVTGDVGTFDPDLQVPYAQTWSLGWQRQIGSKMSVDVRYVGTRSLQGWEDFDFNEVNVVENGFLDEFKLAQQNLQANIASGRGANFRYFGPGTGTAPLPIFLAYFAGLPGAQAGDASRYSNAAFANSTFVNRLARFNPQPHQMANELDAVDGRVQNALRAGLPANFLVANPDLLGGAVMTGNGLATRYNGLQVQVDRRLGNGLRVQANYAYGVQEETRRFSYRTPLRYAPQTGSIGGVRHALKMNWVYDMPFGRDRAFGSGAGPWLDRLIGGWSLAGLARVQSGRLVDFGNVRLVGMSAKEFRDAYKLRSENNRLFMLPQDIIDNTVRAFDASATSATGYGSLGPPTGRYLAPANGPDCIEVAYRPSTADDPQPRGYGECGVGNLVATGPRQVRVDLSIVKRVPIKGRVSADFRAEMINAMNHPWFTAVSGASAGSFSTPDNFLVTTVGENSNRIVQLVWRLNW